MNQHGSSYVAIDVMCYKEYVPYHQIKYGYAPASMQGTLCMLLEHPFHYILSYKTI